MAIHKYRTVHDMPELPLVRDPEERLNRLAALWEASYLVAVDDTPRGVQRFRSVEEADAARQIILVERMRQRRKGAVDVVDCPNEHSSEQ